MPVGDHLAAAKTDAERSVPAAFSGQHPAGVDMPKRWGLSLAAS
jgi:hypothetical protein